MYTCSGSHVTMLSPTSYMEAKGRWYGIGWYGVTICCGGHDARVRVDLVLCDLSEETGGTLKGYRSA